MAAGKMMGPFRQFIARPKVLVTIGLGILIYWIAPGTLSASTRLLLAWNVAIVFFLIVAGVAMSKATDVSMRKRARELDEGRYTILIMALISAAASLGAIVVELQNLRAHQGANPAPYIALSAITILISWGFIHVIFTEHYAHEYYIDRTRAKAGTGPQDSKGLTFPGGGQPDYLDFLYFTFTIGVANQTADISIESRAMRTLVLIHSIISYVFNTIILALTINIAASLL